MEVSRYVSSVIVENSDEQPASFDINPFFLAVYNTGEVGILGRGTVPKGQDKPPSVSLPGLDFVSSDKGRQLLGY